MNKIIIIILAFILSYTCFSQTSTENVPSLWVSYKLEYKKFLNSDSKLSANTILIVTNQGSLFTFEGMVNLDKIQQTRELKVEDVLLNRSPYYHLIKSYGEEIEHYEAVGNDSFKFKEKVYHDWQLVNQDTLINNYSCKKGILNYGGREWIAWYSPEIPTSVGPYKFHGLPGLVMKISDSEGVFNFIVNELKTGEFEISPKVQGYFINEEGKSFEDISPNEFYILRNKFYQMSLNEKIQHMNRENEANHSIVVEGVNGEKPRVNRQSKARNFIERYE
jgi:GLPGLI family protein